MKHRNDLLLSIGVTQMKYWLWTLLKWGILGPVFLAMVAQGLRTIVPGLSNRIYKHIPGLAFLGDYEATYRLDFAPFFALVFLAGVYFFWVRILMIWITTKGELKLDNRGWIVFVTGWALILIDACLFFIGVQDVGWGSEGGPLGPLLATLCYLCTVVFVSFVSAELKLSLKTLKGEIDEMAHADGSTTTATTDCLRVRKGA